MRPGAQTNSSFPDPQDNQRAASNPAASVWVNASAGAGKTTVLTNRVIRLLLSGVRPEKILCLTYTKAGAAEMANRVTDKLSKWAVCDDKTLDQDLDDLQDEVLQPQQKIEARRLFARVLSCPGGLRIRTIHSFCQEVLSRFPIEAGLPPHFALIDEQELETLRSEVLDDLLEEAAKEPGRPLAKALAVLVKAQGEQAFTKMLQEVIAERSRIRETSLRGGGNESLITRMRGFLQLEPDDNAFNLRLQTMTSLQEDKLRKLAKSLEEGTKTYVERSKTLYAILETAPLERIRWFDDYLQLFLTQKNEPRKNFADTKLASKYPEIDIFCSTEALLLRKTLEYIEAADIAETTEAVLFFGNTFAEQLAARKAMRAALDYDDLILFTENLLRRRGISPWILYKLDNGLDHILVDEAQDTSHAQWNIVQALIAEFYAGLGARENNRRTLFIVGDEKQSIFSFQNADPDSFLSLRTEFSRHFQDVGQKLEKIGLHTSFRSAPAILDAVDKIFARDGAREGVSPDPISHEASRNRDGSEKIGRVEIWPLLKPRKEEASESDKWIIPRGYEDEHDPQAELAEQIALKIKAWLKKKEALPGTTKLISPDDIMILLRKRGRFADLMVRALKSNGIPVTGVDRMRLINQLPVMDLLSLLRFVLLPEDDLNLATLLRSPLLGLSEEQLMDLAMGRDGSLWATLTKASSFKNVHAYLSSRLSAADFSTPFAFLSDILNSPCPSDEISGRKALWTRLGDEALDPIEELLNEAQKYSQNHTPSLQKFIHWLTQSNTEIKRELEQGGGQVRIMTVHAAKGLEAPIVFLPDTASLPRSTHIPKFQWSKSDTPLFLTQQPKFGVQQQIWQKAHTKQMQEYRRLFYVALTRAVNCLYICGWLDNKSEDAGEESWYGLAYAALNPHHQEHLNAGLTPTPVVVLGDIPLTYKEVSSVAPPSSLKVSLPLWALQTLAPLPLRPALIPSQMTLDSAVASPDAAFTRGRIIHRLLQSLPEIMPAKRVAAIDRFLVHPRYNLDVAQQQEIKNEVLRLFEDDSFAALFSSESLSEAPLTGTIDGVAVFRQVDRLCLKGNEVWIVDYKTNRPPPLRAEDIPPSYREQVSEYRVLLSDIFPDKKIRCFLLWTYTPELMEVVF